MSKRVSFGSDSNEKPPTTIFNKVGSRKRVIIGVWSIRLPSSKASFSSFSSSSGVGGFSADRFLKRIGAKVARALSFMKRSSRSKVSSSTLPRSKSYAEPLDSHRAEAIEDCIEFLNSASCLKKSNSVS